MFLLFIILIFAYGAKIFDLGGGGKSNVVPFSTVYNELEQDNIKKIEFSDQKITGEAKNGKKFESYLREAID